MSQPKPNYLQLTPLEEAQVRRAKERSEASKLLIDREDLAMAEIVEYLGWGAVQDVMNDRIPLDSAVQLVKCVKELRKQHVYDIAVATRAGTSSVKGSFEKLMKPYITTMKVE